MDKRKEKFNLDTVNLEIFNCSNIDDYIDIPENEQEIIERCRKYLSIEYPIVLHKVIDENDQYWVAEHPDLPGCKTHGKTKEESISNLEDAKNGWIYSKMCDEEEVPLPDSYLDYAKCSGRILLRLPKELHFKLINRSKKDEVSLNQEILYLLTHALGVTESDYDNKIIDKLMEITDTLKQQTVGHITLNVVTNSDKRPFEINSKEYEDIIAENKQY